MTGQLGRKYTATDAVAQIARRDMCEAACIGVEDLTPGCVAELRAEKERLRSCVIAALQYLPSPTIRTDPRVGMAPNMEAAAILLAALSKGDSNE